MSFGPAMLAATAVKTVGNIMQGEAQAGSAKFNARVAQQNAVIAQQQGAAAEAAQQRDAARQIGTMIANYGSSGVQLDSGSPLDVLADSARMAELDRLTIQYNTRLKAAGYQVEAQLQQNQATSARTSALFNAAGSAMGGYSTYSNYKGTPSGGSSRIPIFGG